MTKAVGIIPARWGSTRFPGKPLHRVAGKPLLRHVWEKCCRAKRLDSVIIATDDMRIMENAFDWGAEVALTSLRHQSGTDRIAEVAKKTREFGYVINIQGDEPLIDPRLIDRLVDKLRSDRAVGHGNGGPSLCRSGGCFLAPSGQSGDRPARARPLFFSGRPFRFQEAAASQPPGSAILDGREAVVPCTLRHQGIYGFRRETLLQFVKWKPGPLERAESLEQLRALENGVTVDVLVTKQGSPGIDTPADAKTLEQMLVRAKGRSHSP